MQRSASGTPWWPSYVRFYFFTARDDFLGRKFFGDYVFLKVMFSNSWRFQAGRPFWGPAASEINMSAFIFGFWDRLVVEFCLILFLFSSNNKGSFDIILTFCVLLS